MPAQKMIAVKEFCVHHNISPEFILDLHRNGIIEVTVVKRTRYIPQKNLVQLEKIMRLHRELNINPEGIYTILHLLERINEKDAELTALKNRLEFFLSTDS